MKKLFNEKTREKQGKTSGKTTGKGNEKEVELLKKQVKLEEEKRKEAERRAREMEEEAENEEEEDLEGEFEDDGGYGGDITAEEFDNEIQRRLAEKGYNDFDDEPMQMAFQVYNDEGKFWENMGTEDHILEAEEIGRTYGGGWYKGLIKLKGREGQRGQILTRFSLKLSKRKFGGAKNPDKVKDGITQDNSNGKFDSLILLERQRADKLEQRNHEIMLKILEKPKEDGLETIGKVLALTEKLTPKNPFASPEFINNLINKTMSIFERSTEAKEGKDALTLVGEGIKDLITESLPVVKTVLGNVAQAQAQNRLTQTPPNNKAIPQGAQTQTSINEKVMNALVDVLLADIIFGYEVEPKDDPVVFVDKIMNLPHYESLKEWIMKTQTEFIIIGLASTLPSGKKLQPDENGVINQGLKDYVADVIDKARKEIEKEIEEAQEQAEIEKPENETPKAPPPAKEEKIETDYEVVEDGGNGKGKPENLENIPEAKIVKPKGKKKDK